MHDRITAYSQLLGTALPPGGTPPRSPLHGPARLREGASANSAPSMTHTVQWRDLFVLIDDGHIPIAEYQRLEPLVVKQGKGCPNGLAGLVIIPVLATLPPAAVRQHLQRMLSRLPMRALSYLVEGTGFKAAAARGVLISLGIFQNASYPTKVVTSLDEALRWLLSAPSGGSDVRAATQAIKEARMPLPLDLAKPHADSSSRGTVK